MDALIIIGTILSIAGLIGIVASAVIVVRARKAGLDDEAFRARVKKAAPLNFGALMLSVFGLMMVILGISLG